MELRLINSGKAKLYWVDESAASTPVGSGKEVSINGSISVFFVIHDTHADLMPKSSAEAVLELKYQKDAERFEVIPLDPFDDNKVRVSLKTRDGDDLACLSGNPEPDQKWLYVQEKMCIEIDAMHNWELQVVDADACETNWVFSKKTRVYYRCKPIHSGEGGVRAGEAYSLASERGHSDEKPAYEIRRLVWRRGERLEHFQSRSRSFTERADVFAAISPRVDGMMPMILDSGRERVYREPFVLQRCALIDANTHNLDDLIAQQTPGSGGRRLPYPEAWSILTQLASILALIDVGHGELTPENVTISRIEAGNQVRIGLRSFAYNDPKWRPKQGFFPADASPEQRQDYRRRDNFALGSLLYYMLTGYVPPVIKANDAKTWCDDCIHRVQSVVSKEAVDPNLVGSFLRLAWGLEGNAQETFAAIRESLTDAKNGVCPDLPELSKDQVRRTGWGPFWGRVLLLTVFPLISFAHWVLVPVPIGRQLLDSVAQLPPQVVVQDPTDTLTPIPLAPTSIITREMTPVPTLTLSLGPTQRESTQAPSLVPTATFTSVPVATSPSAPISPTRPTTRNGPQAAVVLPIGPTPKLSPPSSPWPPECSLYANISAPVDGSEISGNTTIEGSAFAAEGDDDAFEHYELTYRGEGEDPNDDKSWHTINASKTMVKNGDLGVFNPVQPAHLEEGTYFIRLRIVDQKGNYHRPHYLDCMIRVVYR